MKFLGSLVPVIIGLVIVVVPLNMSRAAQVLVTPRLILQEEYNDNIFLTPDNEEDDYITSAGLGIFAQINGRTAGLDLNYLPTYNAFADNTDLDYWRHEARARYWHNLARHTTFTITDDFLQTSDPTDAAADVEPTDPGVAPAIETDPDRRGRDEYRTNVAEARLDHQFGANDNVYLSFRHFLLEEVDSPDTPGALVDDYTELRPSAGLEYWFTPRYAFELEGYYANLDYDDQNDLEEFYGLARLLHAFSRTVRGFVEYRQTEVNYDRDFDPNADPDYNVYQPAVGVRYQFQDTGRFTISAGYLWQDVEGGDEDDVDQIVVNSELYKRWNFRSSFLDLIGASGYDVSGRGAGADLGLNIYYSGRLAMGYNFTSRFSADCYGSYRYDEYPNTIDDRVDQILDAGAAMHYQMLQWMNIDLNYRYRDFTSDDEFTEYTENRVWLTVTMQPSTPFRLN